MKKQTTITEKQYQELEKVHGINKTQLDKKCQNSDLVYNNFNYNKFNITNEELNELSGDTKYKHLQNVFKKINEFRKVKSRKVTMKKGKDIAINAASKTFNELMR